MRRVVLLSCVLMAALAAVAQEAWIPLEELSSEEQAQILDGAAQQKRARPEAASSWAGAGRQSAAYARFQAAVVEAGANLLAGVR